MFESQLLQADNSVYSPWIKREGDYLRAAADLIARSSSGGLTVRVFSKALDDTSDGVEVNSGTTISLSAVGRGLNEWSPATGTGLKELVRFKFTATSGTGHWVLFRLLKPIWFDAVKA